MRQLPRILTAIAVFAISASAAAQQFPDPPVDWATATATEQTAVLAGGCFWGVEAVFERLKGVKDVVSGFSGGSKSSANYNVVTTGTTGHAEAVRIVYDPRQISYGTLLKVFFSIAHDPTQLNRQGPDEGPQYRSAIFYADDKQQKIAESLHQAPRRSGSVPAARRHDGRQAGWVLRSGSGAPELRHAQSG